MANFPAMRPFGDWGQKGDLVARVADYWRTLPGCEDILAMCAVQKPPLSEDADVSGEAEQMGFVYPLKSGRFFKIGRSNGCGRRERELAIQLPEKAALVHQIRTDDPIGIEGYWHRRFAALRKNGEWFELKATDVKAFRRRRFM